MAQATSLSSTGVSLAIILNPVLRATTIQYSVASGSSGNALIQYTLDDPTLFGAAAPTWATLSSAIISSAADLAGGVVYSMLSPLGGLRLSSTATVTGTITLKSLQTVTG
jgi:hypothetical protein